MKRWHEEVRIARRNWRNHRRMHVEANIDFARQPGRKAEEIDCPCDDQLGRFRKRDAYDCGNPRCWLCHGDKVPKRLRTQQERQADLKLREGIEEHGAGT